MGVPKLSPISEIILQYQRRSQMGVPKLSPISKIHLQFQMGVPKLSPDIQNYPPISASIPDGCAQFEPISEIHQQFLCQILNPSWIEAGISFSAQERPEISRQIRINLKNGSNLKITPEL
jgi:hypothetical protein